MVVCRSKSAFKTNTLIHSFLRITQTMRHNARIILRPLIIHCDNSKASPKTDPSLKLSISVL